MGEQPIFTTKAHVFQIDPNTKKKWLPASSTAINVSYYHDSNRSSYRIISVEDSKAVINSTITPNMTFTKTSQKFGQWSDTKANTVYGLGFASESELTKFVEKFKEVKELMRKEARKSPIPQSNGSEEGHQDYENSNSQNPPTVPTPAALQNESSPSSLPATEKGSPPSVPGSNLTEAQLKYENDRLKIALAQSSANAKNWEVELQTLRNNNARLMTALQESTANVEEWKKQLAAYKEESARMKRKVLEMEQNQGDGEQVQSLQRRLDDSTQQHQQLQRDIQTKDQEIAQLRQKYEELLPYESLSQRLQDKLKVAEADNSTLKSQVARHESQLEELTEKQSREKRELHELHTQLQNKIADLDELQAKISTCLTDT